MNIKIIVLIALLSGLTSVSAQTQCTVTHYDEFSGMSQWWATQIVQDKQGMIWIATWNGLNRYDGYGFQCFKSRAGDGVDIPSDRIDNMIVADDGSLRCYIDHSVFGFCTKTCKFFMLPEEEMVRLKALFEGMGQNEEVQPYITYQDMYGTEWLIERKGGLQYKSHSTGQYVNYPADWHGAQDIQFCTADKEGNVWLTSNYGVFKLSFHRKPYQFFEQAKPMQVRAFCLDSQQRYWITTRDDATVRLYSRDNQLLGYLGRDGRLHPQYTTFGSRIYHVMQDSKGTFWLSSKPGGLFRLREAAEGNFTIEHFTHDEKDKYSLSNDDLYYTLEDKHGRLWVATFESGVNCIVDPQAASLTFLHSGNGLGYPKDDAQRVRQFHLTSEGILLTATTSGLLIADVSPGDASQIKFRRHTKDASRRNSLSNNAIMFVTEDSRHRLYVCTESGGVNQILSDNLLSDQLSFRHFNTSTGFPSDVALSAIPYDKSLLVVSNNQLILLNPDTEAIPNYESFFWKDQLRFSDATPLQLPDGRFMFGLHNGAFTVRLDKIRKSGFVPPISLTKLTVENGETNLAVNGLDTLVLMPSERDIYLQFAALDYSAQDNIHYAFRMNESDQWTHIGKDRSVTFLDMKPGTYHFQICSTNNDGVWVDNTRTLTIIVQPTFWETRWAYLIYTLLILLTIAISSYLLFLFYHLRQKVTMEQQIGELKLKFFTSISHELRTPLTLINGFVSEIQKETTIGDDIRTRLSVVSNNVQRMLRLANQILDIHKIDSHKEKLCVRHLDLIPFVRNMMSNFDNMAESHQIDFIFQSDEESLLIWADSDKLDKIIFNLLSNAFKYTPKGKIIRVSVERQKSNAVIRVEDQGVGISKESQKHLFEEFTNIISPNLYKLPSSGLGLSLVKKLVTLHDGNISVESESGVGSTFTITLPCGREHLGRENVDFILEDDIATAPDTQELPAIQQVDESEHDSDKETLLIVEDNDQMRFLLRSILSDTYHLIEAENGEYGLEQARKQIPDVIISDIMMPVMDGLELLGQIRKDTDISHIPVILLTAKSDDESQINSLREGADSYIIKPFNSEILKAKVASLLEQRRRLQRYYRDRLVGFPLTEHASESAALPASPESEAFMQRMKQAVSSRISDGNLKVEDIANEMNVSRSVLFKKLKALTGMSPNEYIKTMRMRLAADLIRTDRYSITEITYKVGINDPHYFSNCFKKQYGMSPSEFKNRN